MSDPTLLPYLLAIGANLCFGTASIAFSRFAISHSAGWINQLKVSVAFVCFVIAFFLVEHYTALSLGGNIYIFGSGFVGLCVGDLFLFRALATLGPARTLVLYSFQPFLLAAYGYLFLGQTLSVTQMIAILCMVGCVFTFVWERKRTHGKLDLMAFSAAFLGIFFYAIGIIMSRQAYEGNPNLGSFQANAMRAAGALVGFFLISPKSYYRIFQDVKRMHAPERRLALGSSFLGTFVSLSLYLRALKTAHIATLTAISITLPIWVSLMEHLKLKTWPNRYLWFAFALFLVGFAFMNIHSPAL
jgi:drug/metabolite transporter (DMT)-like permease